MIRKMVCALFAAAMLLGLGLPAREVEDTGALRVSLQVDDLAVTNGSLTLYRVGVRVSDGYRVADSFGGGIVKEKDAESPHLAQWLAQNAGEGGTERLLDADGCAEFSHLTEGLYLVVQTEKMDGFYPIQPFLTTLPSEGQWYVQVEREPEPIVTESPKTGQDPLPFIGAAGMLISGSALIRFWGRKIKKR